MAARAGSHIILDFKNTKKAYSNGMLYLFAEISNLLNVIPHCGIRIEKARNSKINHVLNQIGLFTLCGQKFISKKKYEDVIHWRSTQGDKVSGAAFDEVLDPEAEGKALSENSEIYGAFIEAIKNAIHHAYIKNRALSPVAKDKAAWWMFSQIRNNIVDVVICDLGIGIPNTLPETNRTLYLSVREAFKGKIDAELIVRAIQNSSTRTQQCNRGNGLKKIAQIASDTRGAHLAILSSFGMLALTNKETILQNFKKPLPGTLISWSIPLEYLYDKDKHSK